MAQSLLTQRGVEYGSTMRSLQAVGAKKHPPKKWRSRNQSCSESSSATSDSCSSSDSDGEGSSSRSSATAEREFSIVKESNFANAPLKLKIAARRIKKAQEVGNENLDQEDYSEFPPAGSDSAHNDIKCKNVGTVAKCTREPRERTQRCKRKVEKKRCLQTKDSRMSCGGQYSTCKAARKTRRCSTSGSSSSSSSSGSSSGSSGSSSSGSSSGSSTGCSSNSSSGSSSSGSSSTSGSSSSSSSSSRSSSGSESESCCSASNYTRCRRRKSRRRKASTKCQATCTLQCKKLQNVSESSLSNSQSAGLSEKPGFGKGGKRIPNDCARNKKLQVSDIDYFTISSSDENCSTGDKNASIQECFSMWRKVEEKHCAIIEDSPGNGDLQMQVLSVTNAEVECNINVSSNIGLLNSGGEKHFLVNNKCENQNTTECNFNFHSLEQLPSIIKGHVTVSTTSLDLDALPVSLSNVSPDSGIQSSGDSPLRVDCEITACRDGNQSLVSLVDDYFDRRDSSELTNKLNDKQEKPVSPAHSPPVLIPHDPLWTPRIADPPSIVEIQKSDEDCAPFLVQEGIEVKLKGVSEMKVETMYTDYKEVEFTTVKEFLREELIEQSCTDKSKANSLMTSNSKNFSSETKSNVHAFSQNPLHLMFNDQSVEIEKSETPVFSDQSSPQLLPSTEIRRPKARTPRRIAEANLKTDNELLSLVQSVQDSISSQFQSVESDELSDVDMSSISVTALTCDTTSDSFCDKLSNEENIDILLNDRTCIRENENDSKPFCSSTNVANCDVSCTTNMENSNNLSNISNEEYSEKSSALSCDSSRISSEEKKLTSNELPSTCESVSEGIDKLSLNSSTDLNDCYSLNLNQDIKPLCSDESEIPLLNVSSSGASNHKKDSENNNINLLCNEVPEIVPENTSNASKHTEKEILDQPPEVNVETPANLQSNIKVPEKKGRGRPRKHPKGTEIIKPDEKIDLSLDNSSAIPLTNQITSGKEKRKSTKPVINSLVETKNVNPDLDSEIKSSKNKSNPSKIESNKISTNLDRKMDSSVKNSKGRNRDKSLDSNRPLVENDVLSRKISKCPHSRSLTVDDICENNAELERLINTPVIITDDNDATNSEKNSSPKFSKYINPLLNNSEQNKPQESHNKPEINNTGNESKRKKSFAGRRKSSHYGLNSISDQTDLKPESLTSSSKEEISEEKSHEAVFPPVHTIDAVPETEIKPSPVDKNSLVEKSKIKESFKGSQSSNTVINQAEEKIITIDPQLSNKNDPEKVPEQDVALDLVDNISDFSNVEKFVSLTPFHKPKSNRGRKSKKKNSCIISPSSLESITQLAETNFEVVNSVETNLINSVLPDGEAKDFPPNQSIINLKGNSSMPNERNWKSRLKKCSKSIATSHEGLTKEDTNLRTMPEKSDCDSENTKPIRSKRIRECVSKKKNFDNLDAVIDEVAQSGKIDKQLEKVSEKIQKLELHHAQSEFHPKILSKKKVKNSTDDLSKQRKLSDLCPDKNPVFESKEKKFVSEQKISQLVSEKTLKTIGTSSEDSDLKYLSNKNGAEDANGLSFINAKPSERQKKRKSQPISSPELLSQNSPGKNNSKISAKKTEKQKPSDVIDKSNSDLEFSPSTSPEKVNSDEPSISGTSETIVFSDEKQIRKKILSKQKPLSRRISTSNSDSKGISKIRNSKTKPSLCKAATVSKSKRRKVSDKELPNEKPKSDVQLNKSKVSISDKGTNLISKDVSNVDQITDISQSSSKVNKKDSKKSKVDDEKENLDVRKIDKFSLNKTKSKLSKELKSAKVSEDAKKIPHQQLNVCKEIDFHEKEDNFSSLSLKEDYNTSANFTANTRTYTIDKQSALEMKPIKKKRSAKLYYTEDPNFSIELEKLAGLLDSCYISKKRVKLMDETLNMTIPSIFHLNFCLGKEKATRLSQSNKISKDKPKITRKKPKRLGKAKTVVKGVATLKPKDVVSENCLPLKKRRHITSAQVLNSKIATNDTVVPKTTSVKRNFTLNTSFDETIEECIRKHMMTDEKKPAPVVQVVKAKPKVSKSRDSIDDAIDSCIKNNLLPTKAVSEPIAKESLKKDETEDVPLASLMNKKRKKVPEIVTKPKIVETALAYRQKRKRLIKEACAQSVKSQKENNVAENVLSAQKKRRRFRNKTGFVRVKKKKARAPLNTEIIETREVTLDGEIIDLTAEDNMLDSIESVVKASVESQEPRSRRKRKNVAQKCEIEVLDLTSGNDDDIECLEAKRQKVNEEEELLEPKYQQIIQVTEPSSGRRLAPADPRKVRKKEISLPKKKFLRAGLYSPFFKQDCPAPKKSSSSKKSRSREIKEYIPEDHEFGLMPPPIHVGKYLREKRSEFKLPYDIWLLYKNKQLVYNDELTNNYRKIRTNVYVDIKPVDSKNDDQSCNCMPPKDHRKRGCGTDCLNRMMYVECTPNMCPCRDQCSNQRIFKHEWSPGLERFMTKNRGWGIRTTEYIRSGEFILEYVGEVVSDTEFRHRMAERYRNDQHHYCLSLDSGTVIDGYRLAGEGRFVNHSCEPNCEMQKWFVNGHYRVGLFSLRDIVPYTELCYDYNFDNYNLETQQICRCGSLKCRGFIGGRSQKLNGQNKERVRPAKTSKAIVDSKKGPGRPKKRKDERPVEIQKEHIKNEYLPYNRQSFTIQIKPMSHQQRCYVQKHHCFLLRNYEKVKKAKDEARIIAEKEAERENAVNKQDAFLTQFTALNTSRSIKTRRLATVEENPELTQTAKLAQVFKDIFTAVTSCKGEDGVALANPFFQLPSKKKNSAYYNKIKFPIDFAMIEKNILTGHYTNVETFEDDFLRLFENAEEFYGRTSDFGHKISLLRKAYEAAKTDAMIMFEDILGEAMSSVFTSSKPDDAKTDEDDEVIRCICNIYKDEGLMIQCEKCLVWQHCDCVGVDGKVEKYLCEQCSGIELSKEILMIPRPHYATPECQYYLTLLLNDLQIKQGDCVYLKSDGENSSHLSNESVQNQILSQGESGDVQARNSLRSKKAEQFDIFRIERLWKDEKNNKFAFGHHYLRPHETYHEPSRKFFPNEVFRVPLYESIPLDSIVGLCSVLDLPTYCKGRPKGFKEDDIYICEYRVDKTAHLFHKISKIKYPICTKKYAFDYFDKKRNPKRTFLPHAVPNNYQKKGSSDRGSVADKKCSKPEAQKEEKRKRGSHKEIEMRLEESPESRENKRTHLNKLLLQLLNLMPCKETVDLSYLLEGGLGKRIRRKTNLSLS
ncbi:uncharacterized protein [Parasteatoda tepidariorum]|uniref:uncharacterized protein n=1 Tax=Parasteatoda tepidariorum TaxID=114398 RepID=UPI001C725CFB|nr:serine-rich adhesin for platelets [Parasteatoda tepidariorum]XP_015917305.2 serine-rich adhesin for platelets [Parasteatoda tepidariorum]XP_015917307.2 serine-rich adhesin for platelets [Parasteatoda tepidariorum]